jgi:hypothetical protein
LGAPVISDAEKYAVVKRILQAWDQAVGDFRPGTNDAVIAKAVNLPEIEVRTVRWETVGDTRLEREKRTARDRHAQQVVRSAAQNLERILSVADTLLTEAEGRAETWSQIAIAADDLGSILRKMPGALHASPSESITLEAKAYKKLAVLWDALSSLDSVSKVRRQVLTIGNTIGWSPEDALSDDE